MGKKSGKKRSRHRQPAAPPSRRAAEAPDWPPLAAAVVAVIIVLVSAVGFDDRAFAPFFTPRLAPFYPLVLAFFLLWVWWARPGARPFTVCLGDLLGLALVGWLVLGATLSAAPVVAWLGYYNRGSGAFFWTALVVLLLVARRLLPGARQQAVLICGLSLVLAWTGFVALLQSRGVETWWQVGRGWPGRMTGTTGNPINLAGLSLLAVWLGVTATSAAPLAKWQRVVASGGAAFGLLATALAVTRASYVGLAAALAVVAVAWARARRWRLLTGLGGVAAVLLVAALLQLSASPGGRTVLQRFTAADAERALTRSDSKRVQLWKESLQAVGDRPLTGYGSGAFVVADRRHRPAKRLANEPWNVATDPHSAPLLLLATSGVVGGLLAAALVVLATAVLLRRGPPVDPGRDGARLAALAYATACFVYLLVSPVDLVVVAPLVLIVGAAVGPPADKGRLRRLVPPAGGPTLRRAVSAMALVLPSLALVAVAVAGLQFYRADLAMGRFAVRDAAVDIRRAAELFPWEPLYQLEAGARDWRDGLARGDRELIDDGVRYTRAGIDLDPSGPMGYADLQRLAIAEGRLDDVAVQAREGLRRCPHHPVLQGLWAYSAFHAVMELEDEELGRRLLEGVEGYGPDTPDAWHWIGMTYRALGNASEARTALGRARELAPRMTDKRYEKRLLRGR